MTGAELPHRRYNPLTRQWVLVSPHRAKRPWQGQRDEKARAAPLAYDPTCYLCPGNARAGSERNPAYTGTFVFDNDFAALLDAEGGVEEAGGSLLRAEAVRGICRVICFSPDHSLSLSQLPQRALEAVVGTWIAQTEELFARPYIESVQIFENRGAMMGASNPHPHGQIWATSFVPQELAGECEAQGEYFERVGRPLLSDYLAEECAAGERVVVENEHWVAVVPYWAIWPFETLVLPRVAVGGLPELTTGQRAGLAEILGRLTATYDRVFDTPFPYTMGFHQQPRGEQAGFVLHAHFYPPLLRSAEVRKFMVGFEMLAMPQRDITPEAAAARLRECAAGS